MKRVFNRTKQKAKRRSLRKKMPEAEVILWSRLKGKQLAGFKFRRQCSVGSYFLDFYCPAGKLAVEVDGDSHFTRQGQRRDVLRQQWIEKFGIRFLRFTNDEIRENLDGVLLAIEQVAIEQELPK